MWWCGATASPVPPVCHPSAHTLSSVGLRSTGTAPSGKLGPTAKINSTPSRVPLGRTCSSAPQPPTTLSTLPPSHSLSRQPTQAPTSVSCLIWSSYCCSCCDWSMPRRGALQWVGGAKRRVRLGFGTQGLADATRGAWTQRPPGKLDDLARTHSMGGVGVPQQHTP